IGRRASMGSSSTGEQRAVFQAATGRFNSGWPYQYLNEPAITGVSLSEESTMLSVRVISMLIVCVPPGAVCQSTAAPVFEVASIKPAPPQAPGRVSTRMSASRGRLNYTNVSLRDLIGQAYHLQHGQISGPSWL